MQNTSHAVMAQRTEAKDSLDNFPTPPWATMRKKITIVLMVMTGLSFTGLPTLAATTVWTLIFALQQGG